jgi:hypothetical protein
MRLPQKTHHQAARRWLAAARESFRRAAAGSEGAAYWLMCACEDLLRADEHRALARKWRVDPRTEAKVVHRPLAKTRPAPPVAEEADLDAAEANDRRKLARGYFLAAKQALRLARLYKTEIDSSGRREQECVAKAREYRSAIRELRRAAAKPLVAAGPALSKARDSEPESGRRAG